VQKFFVPEIRGRLVTSFLTSFFSKYLEYGFTADLEQSLDDISNGSKPKLEILRNFWKEFRANVDQTKDIKISDVINKLNEELGDFLFQSSENSNDDSRVCPECKAGALSLKIGRFGSFIGCSRYPECNYVRRLDSSPVTEEDKADAQSVEYPKFLGVDPSDNNEVSLRKGPYGLYIQKDIKKEAVKEESMAKDNLANDSSEDTQEIDSSSTDTTATTKRKTKKGSAKSTKSATKSSAKTPTEKPIRASVPNFINSNNIDINVALSLLKFPKMLGQHNGSDVVIGIGKFGPYVLYQGKYTSAPKTDAVLTMTLNDDIEIFKNKAGKTTPRARNEK
jgi:DNA topoisomerase-1